MSPATASLRSPNVICVDDDLEFLKSLEFFLPQQVNEGAGPERRYDFLFFGNPAEALGAIRELVDGGDMIAMIISDQKMPVMKGIEFLAEARKISADSVRVLLTGYAGIESAITAINESLLDKYLTKPIDNEHDFTLNVRHLLQRYEMQRLLSEQTRVLGELYEFSNTLNGMKSFEDTLDYLARFTQETLRASNVSVLVPELDALIEAARAGLPDSPPLAIACAGPAEVHALLEGGTRVASGLDELLKAGLVPAGIIAAAAEESILFASLTSGPAFLGLLAVKPEPGSAFDERKTHMLEYIANTASIAVHNQVNRRDLELAYSRTREQARALEHANERLQVLDQLKSDFLSFISHEMRTPLSGMSAVGLLDPELPLDEQAELIGVVRSSYGRLQRFVLDGLEYFDWLAGGEIDVGQSCDLAAAARRTATSIREEWGAQVEVDLELPGEPCLVGMAQDHVDRVIQVLVSNALKFSEGRPVRVTVEPAQGGAKLVVRDLGAGFAPELGGEIFRPFTIADPLHHQRGSGLSLATIAAMIETYGGHISASSPGRGKGATFTVEFGEPLAAAA